MGQSADGQTVRITRVYIAEPLPETGLFAIPESAANHLLRVMRLRDGQEFAAFDGSGVECTAVLRWEPRERRAWGIVRERRRPQVELQRRLILYLAAVKGERFDWAVEKATELGVFEIIPLFTDYTVLRSLGRERLERWQRLAESAAAQSGRVAVPQIAAPLPFADAVRRAPGRAVIFQPSGCKPGSLDLSASDTWSLFVGPEGGFSEEEAALAEKCGLQAVGLGARILRVETAALAALCLFGACE